MKCLEVFSLSGWAILYLPIIAQVGAALMERRRAIVSEHFEEPKDGLIIQAGYNYPAPAHSKNWRFKGLKRF